MRGITTRVRHLLQREIENAIPAVIVEEIGTTRTGIGIGVTRTGIVDQVGVEGIIGKSKTRTREAPLMGAGTQEVVGAQLRDETARIKEMRVEVVAVAAVVVGVEAAMVDEVTRTGTPPPKEMDR